MHRRRDQLALLSLLEYRLQRAQGVGGSMADGIAAQLAGLRERVEHAATRAASSREGTSDAIRGVLHQKWKVWSGGRGRKKCERGITHIFSDSDIAKTQRNINY